MTAGAQGLVLPTHFSQNMSVVSTDTGLIDWCALDEAGNCWFQNQYSLPFKTSDFIGAALAACYELNSSFFENLAGAQVTTRLDFPRDWGLGSSSTALYNLSQWCHVNPYKLLSKISLGSGFDLAAAQAYGPVMYANQQFRPISLKYDFKDNLYFVYMKDKKRSEKELEAKRSLELSSNDMAASNNLVNKISKSTGLLEFEGYIREYSQLVQRVYQTQKLPETLSDFWGVIKYLGAWGGDFALATSDKSEQETISYFSNKGFKTVLRWDQIIKEIK